MKEKQLDDWSIQSVWNELITEERIPAPREFIRASEIGRPFLDRYLTMKGMKPTNPFDARILRVFDCGKIFETEVVERIFKVLGLLVTSQDEIKVQIGDLLPVIGHHDPKVGGKIDPKKVMETLSDPSLPYWLKARATLVMDKLIKLHPNGLKVLITEIKTVNSMAFWSHKNQDPNTGFFKGYDNHKLQLYTYLIGTNYPEGRLFYISKDDLTLMETPVYRDNPKLKEEWMKDISEMTRLYRLNKEPPHEPYVVLNETKGIYEPNHRVGRSSFLTYITGCKTQEEWQRSIYPELKRLNSKPCQGCDKVFTISTLKKYNGFCSRCAKKIYSPKELAVITEKGGDIDEN